MVNKRLVVAGILIVTAMGFLSNCDKTPTAPAKTLVGVWIGGSGRQGGGGTGNLDSFYVILTIKEKEFKLVRANKIWGSSLYAWDSSRDAGAWAISAGNITFTPDTANDSCFKEQAGGPWFQCLGNDKPDNYCDCYPPISIKIDTSGNVWHNVLIENSKLQGQFDTLELLRQ